MAEVRWTFEAARWLEDIHAFLSEESPQAAQRVVTGIYEKIQFLSQFPEIGYIYRREPEGNVRILLYGHYRIAYVVRESGVVELLGIFHGALDMEQYLGAPWLD